VNGIEKKIRRKMGHAKEKLLVLATAFLWVIAGPVGAQTKAASPKPARGFVLMPQNKEAAPKAAPVVTPAPQAKEIAPKPAPRVTPVPQATRAEPKAPPAAPVSVVNDRVPKATRDGYVIPETKLGNGLQIEHPGGQWGMRLTARFQADYRKFSNDAALADTFAVRRARLGMGLTLPNKFSVFAEGEFASGAGGGGAAQSANLQQGYVEYSPYAEAKVRLGQFKPQYSLENMTSPWHLDFMERAMHVQLLQSSTQSFAYDRGVMVHGAPFMGAYYGLSLTNGVANNTDELQRTAADAGADEKDVVFRFAANVAPWIDNTESVIHFGSNWRSARVANATGSATSNGYLAASFITEARGLTFFAAEELNSPASLMSDEITRTISGGEIALAWREFKFQFEHHVANYQVKEDSTGTTFSRDIKAGYLSVNWLLTGENFSDAYANGAFGRIRPKQNFGSGGWGAVQMGMRYSYVDASDFSNTNQINTGRPASTSGTSPNVSSLTNKATAITLGLKWMPDPNTAIFANVVQTNFDTPIIVNSMSLGRERALMLRAALDFF
jgi:phosphate-selective porin OprO and OprP